MKTHNDEDMKLADISELCELVDFHFKVFDEKTHIAMKYGRKFIEACYRYYIESPDCIILTIYRNCLLVGVCVGNKGSYYKVFKNCWRTLVVSVMRNPLLMYWTIQTVYKRVRPSRSKLHGVYGYLAILGVDDHYRGQGIAEYLTNQCMNKLRELGCCKIVTSVHHDNLPVRFMYRQMGFIDKCQDTQSGLIQIESE